MKTEMKTENRTRRANNRGAVLITHDGKIKNVPYHGGGLHEIKATGPQCRVYSF